MPTNHNNSGVQGFCKVGCPNWNTMVHVHMHIKCSYTFYAHLNSTDGLPSQACAVSEVVRPKKGTIDHISWIAHLPIEHLKVYAHAWYEPSTFQLRLKPCILATQSHCISNHFWCWKLHSGAATDLSHMVVVCTIDAEEHAGFRGGEGRVRILHQVDQFTLLLSA